MDKHNITATLFCISSGKWDLLEPMPDKLLKIKSATMKKGCFTAEGYATKPFLAWVKMLNENPDIASRWWSGRPELRDRYGSEYLEGVRKRRNDAVKARSPKIGILDMIKSVTKAGREELRARVSRAKVEPEVKQARLSICSACPALLKGKKDSNDRCAECGCFLSTKTSFVSQSCPLGRWGKV